jgi:hypothetical protein
MVRESAERLRDIAAKTDACVQTSKDSPFTLVSRPSAPSERAIFIFAGKVALRSPGNP